MNKRQRKQAQGTYVVPSIRLIELESETPLLAGSVDELEGDTGTDSGMQDFNNIGGITITDPTNP